MLDGNCCVPHDRLNELVVRLKPAQIELLIDMARAMSLPFRESVNPLSDIVTPDFAVNFSNRLLIHHGTHVEKFNKRAFEFAFWKASIAGHREAVLVGDSFGVGADVIIDNVKFSLKTEAEKKLNRIAIKISKLMEARAIRECRTGEDFAVFARDKIVSHLNKYERIVTLRAYDIDDSIVQYDLVEIPRPLLMLIGQLHASDFSDRTSNGSSRATVRKDGRAAFSLVLDGSVEKVTISNLPLNLCLLHASWAVPSIPPANSNSEE